MSEMSFLVFASLAVDELDLAEEMIILLAYVYSGSTTQGWCLKRMTSHTSTLKPSPYSSRHKPAKAV